MKRSDLTAYILAGGSSRRMGVDKLFLQVEGRTLLEHTIATCEACFKQVKLVAGESDKFSTLPYPVILDSPKAQGPMAGIIAALEDCKTGSCFVTAADFIDLNNEIIALLISQYQGQQYLGMIEPDGLQPLCGIYHTSVLDAFYKCAQKKEYAIMEVVKELNYSGIPIPAGQWRNINSKEDLYSGCFHD